MRTVGKKKIDYLLVDISNSHTKLAFATPRRVGCQPHSHGEADPGWV